MISGQFAINLHILSLLSLTPDEYVSSDYIAGSMNLHPVLVRKEIINLKKNGFVESLQGKNGGTRLAKSPEGITLDDIFKATHETVTLGFSKRTPHPDCPVGKKINGNLNLLYQNLNNRVSMELMKISLADFIKQF